jgi:hypothetical protein
VWAFAAATAYMAIGVFATRHLGKLYGVDEVPPVIRVCGIIGWPVAVLMLAVMVQRPGDRQ